MLKSFINLERIIREMPGNNTLLTPLKAVFQFNCIALNILLF